MSDSYYLVNYKAKMKIKQIEEKLETKLLPDFLDSIKKEFTEKYNLDLEAVEEITETISKRILPYSENNFNNLYFDERLGYYTISSYYPYFTFDNIYCDSFGTISSLETLIDFLNKNPDYCIEDENEELVDIKDFCKMIRG